jgi:glucokinase
MVLVTVGTGIGGGLIIGGQLIRGAHGIAAEMGHVRVVPNGRPCGCGRHGCLEQYASGNALVRAARERAQDDPASATRLLELADGALDAINGPLVPGRPGRRSPASVAAFSRRRLAGQRPGRLVQLLDPQALVVGGGVIRPANYWGRPGRSPLAPGAAACR